MEHRENSHAKRHCTSKLACLFALLLCCNTMMAANKIDTGTETELSASGGTMSNEQVDGESFFISGMYIAGRGSAQDGNMTSKGFKLRTSKNNNKAIITVNFPYTITDMSIEGTTNSVSGNSIKVSKVEVDRKEVSFPECVFPQKNQGNSASLILNDINASDSIVVYFDNNDTGKQLNITYSINWERPNASEPTIKMNSKTLALIPGEEYQLSAKVAPKTFDTMWYSDNEEVATVNSEGMVTALSSGKVHIIHAWSDNKKVADTTFLKVTDLGVLTPYIVKKYDFTSMGNITLNTSQDVAGSFYVAGYYEHTPVYMCLNQGLEDIAIQEPLDADGRIGWSIVSNQGLYLGTSADKSAALFNVKSGQIVDIAYTGAKFFIGTYDNEPEKTILNESNGRAIFQLETDGYIGFGISRNSYITSITIYEKKVLKLENLSFSLPDKDILFDGEAHGADVKTEEGMGVLHIYYTDEYGIKTEDKPIAAGTYTISFNFEESDLYYATEFSNVFTFSIYNLDSQEWNTLTAFYNEQETVLKNKWNMEAGISGAKNFYGVEYEKGHVTGIDLSGQNLTGTFPYTLLSLPQLKSINLSGNNLSGDIGTTTYDFAQEHPELMKSVQELNISRNNFSGNIAKAANSFPSLTHLNASGNCIDTVSPMIASSVTNLDLSKQSIASVIPINLSDMSTEAIATKVPSVFLYDHVNQTYSADINLLFTTADDSWEMAMAFQDGQLSIPYVSKQNSYYGENGDILNVALLNSNGTREGSTFRIAFSFDEGDSNFDGQVNVLDLQTMINYLFEKYVNRPYNFTASNLWKDESINVQDIICLVNLLMNAEQESPLLVSKSGISTLTQKQLCDASLYVQEGKLMMNTSKPIAAFDIIISGANSINMDSQLKQMGMTFITKEMIDGMHVIGYSMSGATIPAGISSIGIIDSNASIISHAMLSDTEANAITVSFDSMPTGIDDMNANNGADETKSIYDLQGRRVNKFSGKGLYIQNGHKLVK